MKDVLEENVDEKFYLSDKLIKGFMKHNEHHLKKGTGFIFNPKSGEDIGSCLRSNAALAATDNMIIEENIVGISVHPFSHKLEFNGKKSIKTDTAPALRATDYSRACLWINLRIRRLTPTECFRFFDGRFR